MNNKLSKKLRKLANYQYRTSLNQNIEVLMRERLHVRIMFAIAIIIRHPNKYTEFKRRTHVQAEQR